MSDPHAPLGSAEEAPILALVAFLPVAVDLLRFGEIESLLAPEITVDYSSLWGGEPQRMTPGALMDAWRGLVPGFDATRHELGPITASVADGHATAHAPVDARHWLDGRFWRVAGTYDWTLERQSGGWRIASMTFTLARETGERELVALAAERASTSTR